VGGTRVETGPLGRAALELAEGVSLRLDCAATTPKVLGVRDHLQQVMLNLLMNAVQATPDEGVVEMKLLPDPDQPQAFVLLSVEDSGQGIPEDYLERIFDPFFTTKDPDKGTGLGLMISHQIVADHGGSIEVDSTPGEGATFHVRLPSEGPIPEPS